MGLPDGVEVADQMPGWATDEAAGQVAERLPDDHAGQDAGQSDSSSAGHTLTVQREAGRRPGSSCGTSD